MSEETNIIPEMPEHLKKFNWGAFFLTWIWGIGNNTWIALVAIPLYIIHFIPIIGLIFYAFAIFLGVKGNELAWKNKEWKSEEHFTKVQKIWATCGVIVFVHLALLSICFTIGLFGGLLGPAIQRGMWQVYLKNSRAEVINTIYAASKDTNGKINLSSTPAAMDTFIKYGGFTKVSNDTLLDKHGVYYTFNCKNNSCDILVDVNGNAGPNLLSNREQTNDRIILFITNNNNAGRTLVAAPEWFIELINQIAKDLGNKQESPQFNPIPYPYPDPVLNVNQVKNNTRSQHAQGGIYGAFGKALEATNNKVKFVNSRVIVIDAIRTIQGTGNGLNLSTTNAAVDNFANFGQNFVKVSNDTLKDEEGTYYTFNCKNSSCDILVDVNGNKGPNLQSNGEQTNDQVTLTVKSGPEGIQIFTPDWLMKDVDNLKSAEKLMQTKLDQKHAKNEAAINQEQKPNLNGDYHKHKPHQPHKKGEKHPKEKHGEQ